MKVFVTGASGYIGSVVTAELLASGHEVTGLARSEESAAKLTAAGASVVQGTLSDVDIIRSAAAAADGVIHLAFDHSGLQGDFAAVATQDRTVVAAIGEVLVGTDKPFVVTSGTMTVSGLGRPGTEKDVASGANPRGETEGVVVALASRGVRSSVVRLAPTVHSDLDAHGFVPSLIGMAKEHGSAAYVGDGANKWPAVHVRDAAHLFCLALENAKPGSVFNAAAEEGLSFRSIAEAIGKRFGVPPVSVAPPEAREHLGFLADFAQIDDPTSSELTKQWLGWEPTHHTLFEDIEQGHYDT